MNTDYERIERAIVYIQENVENQPNLEAVAEHIGLSPYHFNVCFNVGLALRQNVSSSF